LPVVAEVLQVQYQVDIKVVPEVLVEVEEADLMHIHHPVD
jgi:hypothetical protein